MGNTYNTYKGPKHICNAWALFLKEGKAQSACNTRVATSHKGEDQQDDGHTASCRYNVSFLSRIRTTTQGNYLYLDEFCFKCFGLKVSHDANDFSMAETQLWSKPAAAKHWKRGLATKEEGICPVIIFGGRKPCLVIDPRAKKSKLQEIRNQTNLVDFERNPNYS
ncbi:hypothetical protein CCACVL1_29363 [Corchorus capsularis]|uniref:Uncharacterized protein n=1 Tax=Corchorus capsularis TaxID=210143 RepID=A0A1R3G1Y5_COCAP|nr:hypothetical protein CCACVL1_29363 [Corchorus capsularis]